MFFQMLEMIAQSIASTLSPQIETYIRASRVFKFNLLRKWLLIAFWLKNPLTKSYTWWNEYNFLRKLNKFRPICMFFQIATTYAPSLKYRFVLTLMSKCLCKVSSWVASKLTQYLLGQSISLGDLLEQIVHSHTYTKQSWKYIRKIPGTMVLSTLYFAFTTF